LKGWLAHKKGHPNNWVLYAWDNNQEQMTRAKRPPFGTNKGTSWGSFSSRHGPSYDDGTNDDCVIIDCFKQMKVFLPKQ
jgi:hypothetical protein